MKRILIVTLVFCFLSVGLFAETTLVYHHDGNGDTIFGSKEVLIDAVKQGKNVRFMIVNSEQLMIGDAEWVWIRDNEIYASNTSQVSVIYSNGTLRFFDESRDYTKPYNWFVIAGTNGLVDMSRWIINTGDSYSHTNNRCEIKWFIN